jgi:hypothetical protein
MELPPAAPEPSRLQHTLTFLGILVWVTMLFYLSHGLA